MTVLVTGAAGGIGQAVVKYLSEKNVSVYACDIAEKSFPQENVTYVKMDVSDVADMERVFSDLQKTGILFDAFIHIAGIFYINSFLEIDNDQLRNIFRINLLGAVYVNKIFYPLLKKNGRIVITTSDVAPLDPMPFNGIYNVTKTALDSYAQALRQELNLLGKKVITVRPGAFNTSLSQGALEKTRQLTQSTALYKKQSDKFYALVKGFMGAPRPPEAIAKTYYRAITEKHPKLIYTKNANIPLHLMNLLPKRLQCAIIRRMLKGSNGKSEK